MSLEIERKPVRLNLRCSNFLWTLMWQVPPHKEIPAHKEYDLVTVFHYRFVPKYPRNQTERVKTEVSDAVDA